QRGPLHTLLLRTEEVEAALRRRPAHRRRLRHDRDSLRHREVAGGPLALLGRYRGSLGGGRPLMAGDRLGLPRRLVLRRRIVPGRLGTVVLGAAPALGGRRRVRVRLRGLLVALPEARQGGVGAEEELGALGGEDRGYVLPDRLLCGLVLLRDGCAPRAGRQGPCGGRGLYLQYPALLQDACPVRLGRGVAAQQRRVLVAQAGQLRPLGPQPLLQLLAQLARLVEIGLQFGDPLLETPLVARPRAREVGDAFARLDVPAPHHDRAGHG